MAFGFPAYHVEELDDFGSDDDARDLLARSIRSLRWTIRSESRQSLHASTGLSFWSWGERIEIRFLKGDAISIRSQCSLPTQCVDWGKNRRNVRNLIDAIRDFEDR